MAIALGSLVWNIWSKFIYPKPKARAYINLMSLMPNPKNLPKVAQFTITNYGPGFITAHSIYVRINNGWFKNKGYAMLNPLSNYPASYTASNGPFSGGLPKKLEEGEQFALYFPLSQEWINSNVCDFGFSDTLGRTHWCNKGNSKKFIGDLKKELNKGNDN